MQGEENKKDERGGVARVGVAPKEKGVKGVRGSPEALILGQIRQRSRAVLGALSAGAKLGRSGWGVAYQSRALMSPPFWWNSCGPPACRPPHLCRVPLVHAAAARHRDGFTPLMHAVHFGATAALGRLVELRADLDAQTKHG